MHYLSVDQLRSVSHSLQSGHLWGETVWLDKFRLDYTVTTMGKDLTTCIHVTDVICISSWSWIETEAEQNLTFC